jgi:hypothetical protein
MATLNLNEYTHKIDGVSVTAEQKIAKGRQVKMLGIIALGLLLLGLVPILGFFAVVASLVISRMALKISRENFVDSDYERPAYWASLISAILLILSVIGLIFMLLSQM